MYIRRVEQVLQRIALKHNISVGEVKRAIEESIFDAVHNKDPYVQARWSLLFPDGRIPTPEELIEKLSVICAGKK